MKKFIFIMLIALFINCNNNEKHYHDGNYSTTIEVFGISFAEISYEISGNEIEINNSVTGTSKLTCEQFPDRIEYKEKDGVVKVLMILENGDVQVTDDIVLKKVR